MAKKKGPNQVLEQHSRGRLQTLFADWVVNSLDDEDYAFDFTIRPVGKFVNPGEVIPTPFFVQLKATDSFDGNRACWDFETEYLLEDCLQSTNPVVIMLYERESDAFHWCIVQDYCVDVLDEERSGWREQETVRITIDSDPMTEATDKLPLKSAVGRAHQRITTRSHVASVRRDGLESSADVELASLEEVARQEARMVEQAKRLLEADERDLALERLMEVYQMPEDSEATLEAIRHLLAERKTDDPSIAFAKLHFAREGYRLAEEYGQEDELDEFEAEFDHGISYLEATFIGATYVAPETGVPQTILDIEDWGVPTGGAGMLALTQSGGGIDSESAQGIADSFEMVESGESWNPRDDACTEREHEFDPEELRTFRGATECAECGLYRDVVEQWLGHDIPEVCEECKSIGYELEFSGHRYCCPDCR